MMAVDNTYRGLSHLQFSNDVKIVIFSYLSVIDLVKGISVVNKEWNQLSKKDQIWESKIVEYWWYLGKLETYKNVGEWKNLQPYGYKEMKSYALDFLKIFEPAR